MHIPSDRENKHIEDLLVQAKSKWILSNLEDSQEKTVFFCEERYARQN